MWQRLRRWWPVGKRLLAVVILVAIGRQFARDLPVVWQRTYDVGWLAAAGALYLLGLAFSAVYWRQLLLQLGQRPAWPAVIRAYYIGHFGKYLPGKAWAVLLRSDLASGPGVKAGYAALTAFYEVLTTMASGVLLAAGLVLLLMPDAPVPLDWQTMSRMLREPGSEPALFSRGPLALLAVCLFVPIALPLLPAVFNRVAHRLSLPFRDRDATPLARVEARVLPAGFLLTMIGWACLGASTWAVLRATVPDLPWTLALWGQITAVMGIAYVMGFAVLLMPGGLGVREFFLTLLLAPELVQVLGTGEEDARRTALAGVIVLRLTWTAAEIVMAAVVYWLPVPVPAPAEGGVA
jgi:uncharacterized membrane protein YbhN (UPF0104 family)